MALVHLHQFATVRVTMNSGRGRPGRDAVGQHLQSAVDFIDERLWHTNRAGHLDPSIKSFEAFPGRQAVDWLDLVQRSKGSGPTR